MLPGAKGYLTQIVLFVSALCLTWGCSPFCRWPGLVLFLILVIDWLLMWCGLLHTVKSWTSAIHLILKFSDLLHTLSYKYFKASSYLEALFYFFFYLVPGSCLGLYPKNDRQRQSSCAGTCSKTCDVREAWVVFTSFSSWAAALCRACCRKPDSRDTAARDPTHVRLHREGAHSPAHSRWRQTCLGCCSCTSSLPPGT